ncbi:MAG TPA: hypothetical protein VF691_12685 [Cytophagaceae bacterium]|jgi:hypothetical protein
MLKISINVFLIGILLLSFSCKEKFNGASKYYDYCKINGRAFELLMMEVKSDSLNYKKKITFDDNSHFKNTIAPGGAIKDSMKKHRIHEIYWDPNEVSFRFISLSKSDKFNSWWIYRNHNVKDTMTSTYYIKVIDSSQYFFAEMY